MNKEQNGSSPLQMSTDASSKHESTAIKMVFAIALFLNEEKGRRDKEDVGKVKGIITMEHTN